MKKINIIFLLFFVIFSIYVFKKGSDALSKIFSYKKTEKSIDPEPLPKKEFQQKKPSAPRKVVRPSHDQIKSKKTVLIKSYKDGIVYYQCICKYCGKTEKETKQARISLPGQKKMESFKCTNCGKRQKVYIEAPK